MTLTRLPASLRVFALAFIGYAISSQVWAHPTSLTPHYVYLAHSLLSGHLDLIQLPPTSYDLLFHNNLWFVAGAPLPALLILPFVAIFGVAFSDVLFSVVVGAINVALVYELLGLFRRSGVTIQASFPHALGGFPTETFGNDAANQHDSPRVSLAARQKHSGMTAEQLLPLSESARRWLTLLFAFGTPHWYLASLGTYWFTAHIVAVCFALLAAREALGRQRWFLAGLWLAAASLARPTALGLAPFFVALIVYSSRTPASSSRATRYSSLVAQRGLSFGLALLIGLSVHGAYNLARFGKVADFGYGYVVGAPNITTAYARYGGFNLRFLPCNLAVSLLAPPEINGAVPGFITQPCGYLLEGANPADASVPLAPNPLGMSVFLVTPALLLIFTTLKRRPVIVAAWIGLLSTLLPLWLYHNTGSLQFGWRYLLDAAPLWIILLACALPNTTRLNRGLILISIAMNAWGMLWMFEKIVGRSWF